MRALLLATALPLILTACTDKTMESEAATGDTAAAGDDARPAVKPFQSQVIADFDEPWAMTFMPDERLLVTEKDGRLRIVTGAGTKSQRIADVAGMPKVDYGGQSGLGDVVLAPDFAQSNIVYLSWVEAGASDTRGAVVGRGKLICAGNDDCRLDGLNVIWRQDPKVTGRGHFSHRIAFSPGGEYLFLSSGDRQKMTPAQNTSNNLGSILRLNLDGSPAAGNPFADRGVPSSEIWSYGHRNALGLAFAPNGNLWQQEMGPKGGDEINLIARGQNYGWPVRSNGDHYDGSDIPDHSADGEYKTPKVFWNPAISPAGMIYYTGSLFPEWQNSLLLGGLSGQALIQVKVQDQDARKAGQWDMGARIREVEQGPEGAVWLLEDGKNGSRGRLLKLTPRAKTAY